MTSSDDVPRTDGVTTLAGRPGDELTRRILDVAHDAFVGMDDAGRIVAWNASAERIFGRSAADVAGADLAETIIPTRFHAAHREGLRRFLATGEGPVIDQRIELVGLHADGAEFPVELTISHVAVGEERMFCAFIRDMTAHQREAAERRRAEAALAAQYEVARVLAEAPHRDEAVPRILRAVAEPLGWAVGELWLPDESDEVVRCVGTWATPDLDLAGFMAPPDVAIRRGVGLPGRVWAANAPVWLDDLEQLATPARRAAAAHAGLRHAVGLPITSGGRVVGIVTFLGTDMASPTPEILGLLTFVSEQVGQFTAREAALAAQARSEARFRFLAEHAGDMISRHAADGTYLYVSPASRQLYGYEPEELVGTSPYDGYHPDDVATVLQAYDAVPDGPAAAPIQYRRRRKDGSFIWVEATTRRIRDAETGTVELIATTRSVDARVRAEQQLRESRELLQAMLDHTAAIVFSKDRDGRYLFVNRRFEELFDAVAADLVGRTDEELWGPAPADVAEVRDNDRRVLETGTPLVAEEILPRPDGAARTYLSTKFPLLDGDGVAYAIAGIAVDITQQKADEESLRVALEELERRAVELQRSNEELDRFAHVASHDLSAPLRVVVGYLQLLRKLYGGRLGADADELIDGAVDGARRMRVLIDDLLAYAAVGASPRAFEPVDLSVVVHDVLALLRPTVTEKGAAIEVGDLPVVPGDDGELRRLFQNLLENALKFTRTDAPQIRIDAERASDLWRVRVSDNGIGVDPAHAERIFAMFGRLHGHEEFSGTGAGLALCQKVVDRHGGTIHVEQRPAGGSTFVFTLRAA